MSDHEHIDLYAKTTEGRARELYLGAMTGLREYLDGTAALDRWDRWVQHHPRSLGAHLRSMLAVHNAADLADMDLPWWTYRATDRVDGFLAARGGDARAFEYGSGASTVWLARRCHEVTSIEHHPDWADRVRRLLADHHLDNATVHTVPAPPSHEPGIASTAPTGRGRDFTDYVAALEQHPGPWDVVTVDGRARGECLMLALEHVADDGMVLLDDAQRSRYQPWLDKATAMGWRIDRNRGSGPCSMLLHRDTAMLTASHGSLD